MKRSVILASVLLCAPSAQAAPSRRHIVLRSQVHAVSADDVPMNRQECTAEWGFVCYAPLDMRQAYGVDRLVEDGHDGTGQTIVLFESFGSPFIANDLAVFDDTFGIPAPPSFQVIAPLGTVPFDPNDFDQFLWALETTIDVELAHAMAPGAGIVVLTSPVDETEGSAGMPEMIALANYALDHRLGSIFSMSWGATENTLMDAPGQAVIAEFEEMAARARRQHVTIIAATGDSGAANLELDDETFFQFPTVNYPSSSPNVLAMGGTELLTDDDGNWLSEKAWDEFGATGGGVSQVFREPLYQVLLPRATQKLLGHHRGLPDLAMEAGDGVLIFLSGPDGSGSFFPVGGTSISAPMFGAIVAILDQVAHRPLGFLNDKVYLLGELGLLHGATHDITVGNNSYNIGDEENPIIVPGYDAGPGWDATSGWGSPRLEELGRLLSSMRD